MSHPEAALDLDFYRAHHEDLHGLSARQALNHYRRHGRPEGRPANAAELLQTVQTQALPLPADFEPAQYLRLNPDLKGVLPHPWQPAVHYVTCGRKEGRRYLETDDTSTAPRPPSILWSSVEALRRTLVGAFGEDQVSLALVHAVHSAHRRVQQSASLARDALTPVLLARWLLHCTGVKSADFASLHTQLQILYQAAFSPVSGPVWAMEAEAIDQARALAIDTVVFQAPAGYPPLTLLMLAAEATYSDAPAHAPSADEVADLLARFFVLHVPRRALQRFVTRAQRGQLRALDPSGAPVARALLERFHGRSGEHSGEVATARFWSHDVWLAGLDYILTGETLQAQQLVRVPGAGGPSWRAPARLAQFGAPETDEAWRQAIAGDRAALPQILVGPSALAWARGEVLKAAPVARSGGRLGRKSLRPSQLATFCVNGSGISHVVGPGWRAPQTDRICSHVSTVLLAFDLGGDEGELDVFLQVSLSKGASQIWLYWNGRLIAATRVHAAHSATLHGYLGASHHSGGAANLLCLAVDNLEPSRGDREGCELALHSLMLVQR